MVSFLSNEKGQGIDRWGWRREWDSNPRPVAGSLVFKTSSLNRSDISPNGAPDQNRTGTICLEGRSSTIKLQVRMVPALGLEPRTSR